MARHPCPELLPTTVTPARGLMTVGATIAFRRKDVVTPGYGDGYSDAARILPAMVAAGIPWAITSLYLAEVRILHRHIATVAITGALMAAIVLPALVLVPDEGVDGASVSWFVGNVVAALVAIGAIYLTRRLTSADPSLSESMTMADATEVGVSMAEHSA